MPLILLNQVKLACEQVSCISIIKDILIVFRCGYYGLVQFENEILICRIVCLGYD